MKMLWRWMVMLLLSGLALQLYFVGRIALMSRLAPESSTFERADAYRLSVQNGLSKWRQQWVPYAALPDTLKQAVIASEDGSFLEHDGVDMDALEKAWEKNAKAEQRAAQLADSPSNPTKPNAGKVAKIIGGSTITQQLAKNLFLSGERTLLRKGQELILTLTLEALLSKQRILEIYLNHVEWGEGIFGAEAAAQHYYKKPAAKLSSLEAAKLAVMLPRPKYFETHFNSGYLASRANTIAARMRGVEVP